MQSNKMKNLSLRKFSLMLFNKLSYVSVRGKGQLIRNLKMLWANLMTLMKKR